MKVLHQSIQKFAASSSSHMLTFEFYFRITTTCFLRKFFPTKWFW